MKLNKVMPIVFVLLAVLTIGAVNASDNFDLNDTLTEDNIQNISEVSLDYPEQMSDEDVSIDVKNIDGDDSSTDFADVFLTEKEGSFVICKGEGEETLELYREDISLSDRVGEDEGVFHLGVSLDDVNFFISETIDEEYNFYDVAEPGDVLRFVLEYHGEDLAVKSYTVDFDENTIFFNEASRIGSFIWNSDGKPLYIDCEECVVDVGVPEDTGGSIVVCVDDDEYEWEIEGDYHQWSLSDLEITQTGEYNIIVKYIDEEGVEEIINEGIFTVVEFNNDAFRAEISYDKKRIKFFCPEGSEGTISITVERFDEGEGDFAVDNKYDYDINEYCGEWSEISFDELNVPSATGSRIKFEISDEQYFLEAEGYLGAMVEIYTFNVMDNGIIYADCEGYIFELVLHEEFAMADITVNGISKFHTKLYMTDEYSYYFWNLKTLGMSETGEYDVKIRIMTENSEETHDYTFNVVDFKNDTFRVKYSDNEENDKTDVFFFCPDGASGTVTLRLMDFDDEDNEIFADEYTYEINSTMYNKWTLLPVVIKGQYNVYVSVDDNEIYAEKQMDILTDYFSVQVNDWGNIYDDGIVARIYVPFNQTCGNYTFSICSGENEIYSIKLSELQARDYEWFGDYGHQGCYAYEITVDDVNSLDSLSDKDEVLFNLINPQTKSNSQMIFHVKKDEELMEFHPYEAIRINLVDIHIEGYEEDEEDELNISENSTVISIYVPDELNITETAIVRIAYGDNVYTKNLKDFESEYQYNFMGNVFHVALSDLNPENLKNGDLVNITLLNNGEVIGNKPIIAFINDEGVIRFDEFIDSIDLEFHFGEIGHSEFGMGESDGNLMILTIPDYLNITDGVIQLLADDGTVLFSKALSEFDENCTNYDGFQSRDYKILDNVTLFDYSCIPDGVNFTAVFAYGNTTLSFDRVVRIGDVLYSINTPRDISKLFKVTVSEGILCDGGENAIIIEATDAANRQSIYIDIGGGYFAVYVNGNKVEDLGRLVRYGNETELELFRLSSSPEGVPKLYIYLDDLNITENGIYNIRVTHVAEGGNIHRPVETELFNKNLTLTSNVKVNYQNSTAQLFTGYGFNPVLLYLDTYYDDISSTNGTITVINSKGTQILSKDIRDLSYDNGRYYLSYCDFENRDFGDNITVRYSNGNERNGETTLDVMWKDVESDDFTPALNSDVNDYYGNFVNMNIPALINTGQIIVTLKFKNNHGSNISNMNVTTDFDSQAVYTFNVADIKANSEDGNLNLAMSDLGFYEINGDYEIDVKFTADGTDTLDVAANNLKVEFLDEIQLDINETSRYANELPFASVKVFEPVDAYAELYIDGVLYSHKTFEKGFISFDSSSSWTSGNHTAELTVFDSEFGSVLNSTSITFETLIHTGDVEVSLNDTVKEGENVLLTISVPKDSEAVIQIDNSAKNTYTLQKGDNIVDLGVLDYGNHTIFIAYNTTLDNGDVSYYTNYLSMFVGDDGHWLNLPEPLVLNDDDTVRFSFGEDAKGNVSVVIDGVEVSNLPLVNGSGEVNLTELITGENRYGRHTYNITYTGDETHDSLSKSGEFEVTYLFKDNLVKEGFPLMENYEIAVTLPQDAEGNVTLLVGGKTYTSAVNNGIAAFKIDNLSMGEHNVTISYSGDGKYPSASYTNVLNVSYYAVIGEFSDSKRIVSLILPSDATGNLTVYNDNMAVKLNSVALANGKASVDLSQLSVGKYELRAVYEADDYDVRQFTAEFDVLPQIYISRNITVGETAQILVDLDNSKGHLLVLVEGVSPQLIEIENGIVNYTFSTEGLSKGNHTVSFQYFGTSFDKNIFYEVNKKTGYPMPINFNLSLLPKSPQVNTTPGDDWIIVDCGNATGTIEVFVNGVSAGVVDIVKGLARIDLSGFKNGIYNITFKYSGDSIYDEFTGVLTVDVIHKVAKIKDKNTNVVYSAKGKYSVTVYDKDGKAAENVKVTFVIGTKTYKTATTNSKGVASIVIGKNPGTYKITAKALGVSSTKKLTVKHLVTLKKVTVKRSAKKLTLTATLSKVNKKYLKNKKITFKFNGKKYTAKTNSKGVAKVTVKSSVLQKLKAGKKVTYQATYLKDTVKRSVKVKK